MSALFMRDVWPAWTAQEPPPMTTERLARLADHKTQLGIFAGNGNRLGTAWREMTTTGATSTLYGTVLTEPHGIIPATRTETTTDFNAEGGLEAFTLAVYGIPETLIQATGERHGIFFPCEFQFGVLRRRVNLDLSATRMIGDSLQPFGYLPELRVGQAWRMQILDPLSALAGGKVRFQSVVARVTGSEVIDHQGRPVECFVVVTDPHPIKAWVDDQGQVCVQEAEMPGFGKVVLRAEPYDALARQQARQRISQNN
ncbi:MAG: hypothetical protein GXY44_04325 [Phycisphaerales bacterium]|nr:hypothetical protein [Phycisphaerales bacterium]